MRTDDTTPAGRPGILKALSLSYGAAYFERDFSYGKVFHQKNLPKEKG